MVGISGRSGGNRAVGSDHTDEDSGPIKPELPEAVSQKWDQLIGQLPKPALRRIDCHELKLLSELLVMADGLSKEALQNPADHKTGRLFLNVADRIHKLSAVFGLNPGDRKRLNLKTQEDAEDPFKRWLEEMRGEV